MSKKTKTESGKETDPKPIYGNPEYSAKDDIYAREEKEEISDSDEEPSGKRRNIKNSLTGDDLDVPGSELDDADEEIGEEDEENNYYSLGGDDHDDLEEDKGE